MTERDELKEFIERKFVRYGQKRRQWGFLHYSRIGSTIVFSWAAALILGLQAFADLPLTADAAAVLAALAGLATALGAGFGFERKWRASMTARRKTESLLAQLTSDAASLDRIRTDADKIYEEWAQEIGYEAA